MALSLFILAIGVLAAVPGALALRSSSRNDLSETALERKLHDLETEVQALRNELAIVRAERERQASDLAAAKIRIADLERVVAAYEQRLLIPGRVVRSRDQASSREEALLKERKGMEQALSKLREQILVAGSGNLAAVPLQMERERIEGEIKRIEGELDEERARGSGD